MTVHDGDLLKIVAHLEDPDGNKATHKFYLAADFITSVPDLDVLTGIRAWLETAYAQLEDSLIRNATLDGADVDVIEWDGEAWRHTYDVGLAPCGFTFDRPGLELPIQIAAVVTFPTARIGTRVFKFVPFATKPMTLGGIWHPAYVTALTNFAAALLVSIDLGEGNYLHLHTVQALGPLCWPLIGASVGDLPSAMTRRRPRS